MRWLVPPLLLAIVLAPGCRDKLSARYRPESAVAPPRTAKRAMQFYRGDIQAIASAGGRVLGTLEIQGEDEATRDAIDYEATRRAAEAGGTHVFLVREGEIKREEVQSNDVAVALGTVQDQMACNNGNFYRCFNPSVQPQTRTVAVEYPTGTFFVLYVDPRRWTELPPQLRPKRYVESDVQDINCRVPPGQRPPSYCD